MTATVNLDLTNLLCRYAIDQAPARCRGLEPQDVLAPRRVRPARRAPGDQGADGGRRRRTSSPAADVPRASRARRRGQARRRRRPAARSAARRGGLRVITRKTKLKLLAFAALAVLGMSYLGFNYVGLDRAMLGNGYEVAADFTRLRRHLRQRRGHQPRRRGRPGHRHAAGRRRRPRRPHHRPGRRPDPGRHRGGRRHPQRGGGAVRRPAARRRRAARSSRTARSSRRSAPTSRCRSSRCCSTSTGWSAPSTRRTCGSSSTSWGAPSPGAGDDLGRLIDNGDLLLARAEESLPQTLRLITDGQTVLETQVDEPLGDPAVGRRPAAGDRHPGRDRSRPARPRGQRARRRRRARGPGRRGAGPGLGSLVRNLDILNKVHIPRLDGVEQMLVTYPDVVSGGFTVVRRRRRGDGQMRSHFGFVLNAGDPHPARPGTSRRPARPARARSRRWTRRGVACQSSTAWTRIPATSTTRTARTSAASRTSAATAGAAPAPQERAGGASPPGARRSSTELLNAPTGTPTPSPAR